MLGPKKLMEEEDWSVPEITLEQRLGNKKKSPLWSLFFSSEP